MFSKEIGSFPSEPIDVPWISKPIIEVSEDEIVGAVVNSDAVVPIEDSIVDDAKVSSVDRESIGVERE